MPKYEASELVLRTFVEMVKSFPNEPVETLWTESGGKVIPDYTPVHRINDTLTYLRQCDEIIGTWKKKHSIVKSIWTDAALNFWRVNMDLPHFQDDMNRLGVDLDYLTHFSFKLLDQYVPQSFTIKLFGMEIE